MDGKRALFSFVLTVVVACGGAAPATGGAGAGASAGASAAAATSSAPAASGGAGAGTAASGPKLADLLTAAKLSQYKITYKYSVGGAGASISGEQSWFFKPPKQRFDFSTSFGGQTTLTSVFALPDGTYYCMTLGAQKQCFGIKGAGSPLDSNMAAVFQRQMIENPAGFGGTFVENKTIAGQQGQCYDVKPTAASSLTSGRWCFTKEGIMLLSSFSAQGSSVSLEATNVSLTVPDSDFELPAKPVSTP